MSQKVDRTRSDLVDSSLFDGIIDWTGEVTEQALVNLQCARCSARVGVLARWISDQPTDDGPLFVAHLQVVRGVDREVVAHRYRFRPGTPLPPSWCRVHHDISVSATTLYQRAQAAIASEADDVIIPKTLRCRPAPRVATR